VKHKALIMVIAAISGPLFAGTAELQSEIRQLQEQTKALQTQLDRLQTQLIAQSDKKPKLKRGEQTKNKPPSRAKSKKTSPLAQKQRQTDLDKSQGAFHAAPVVVHAADGNPNTASYYPTALIAEGHVITYIAGTPVVVAPYTGDRPAFDGSDYIVNISSINRDIRLMEQRRRVYKAYERIGYPAPSVPIIALSGKAEPVADITRSYSRNTTSDFTLGSSELDVAAWVNHKVEAFLSVAYDESPPPIGPRTGNSSLFLNQGFVNIGDLDVSPIYFTAGQIFVPFGRYSSSMISAPLPLRLARTKSRPFILGYKSQMDSGPFAAVYGFRADTTNGHSGIGGVNLGYTLSSPNLRGEIGASYISSVTDSSGMQDTGSIPFTTFGGFASPTNGSENIHKVPGFGVHGSINYDRYNFTAEWVGVSEAFRLQDLSFNGHGAKPMAAQLEAGVTFMVCSKPASLALGYQWSKETLALNLPERRLSGVFNISLWKDTVESLEYRHDTDFSRRNFANGAQAPGLVNQNTIGTGGSSDSLIAQIGVYF
jgi:hypothetical protein